MNRRSAVRQLAAAGAVSFFGRLLRTTPAADLPDFRSEARLVLLDVSVKNGNGALVSGLSREDFQVFENGKPQPITVFANVDVPVTLGIVVDESFSMTPKRLDVIEAAQDLIHESNPNDEVFVLNFNDTVKRGLPDGMLFSDDMDQLREALYRGKAQGKTALNDAVVAGLEQLKLGRRDKKTLVLVSDGGDNVSNHGRREMLEMVRASSATLYTIGLFTVDDPDKDPAILKALARISGGEVYFPQSPEEMAPVCRQIAKDIRARYTLGYVPQEGNGVERRIGVRVAAPGHKKLMAHTRPGYRYEEAADGKNQ
jgi:Ca-activated chloride channel homolog